MKFKAGDRFQVKDSDIERGGIIIDTTFNSIYQEYEYVVKWDDFRSEYSYPTNSCDSTWELVSSNNKSEINCLHNWVIYNGFRDAYEYCSKCDLKKE